MKKRKTEPTVRTLTPDEVLAIKESQGRMGVNNFNLAKALGCSPSYITHFFNGDRPIGLDLAERMYDALGQTSNLYFLTSLDKATVDFGLRQHYQDLTALLFQLPEEQQHQLAAEFNSSVEGLIEKYSKK